MAGTPSDDGDDYTDSDIDLFGGWDHDEHVHDFGQLIYVPLGHAVVWADDRSFHLSETVALWVPAGRPHSALFDPDSIVFGLGFGRLEPLGPSEVADEVVVGPHLRSLLLSHVRSGCTLPAADSYMRCGIGRCCCRPDPQSEVTRAVADRLRADPADARTAGEWAAAHFISAMSLRRSFLVETGLTFSEWRTRLRLNLSVELLADGYLVGSVAGRVGFTSSNGYILAFRRYFGQTPKAFISA